MSTPSVVDLVRQIRELHLLNAEQLAVMERALLPRRLDTQGLLHELVLRGWLTPHKAQLLVEGRGHELAPTATVAAAPEPEILEYARPWKLGAILGGVALVILLIAILLKPGKKPPKEPSDGGDSGTTQSVDWPNDLTELPGVTETRRRDGASFSGKNTHGDNVVYIEGRYIIGEAKVDRVVVQTGSKKKEYRDLDSVPQPRQETARILRELASRELFGTWKR